jgi:membrane protein
VHAPSKEREGTSEPAPGPQPEHEEPKLRDPRLRDLTLRDWLAIFQRAGKESLDDNVPMIASALAYSSFFAIPSTLLLAVGLFAIFSGPDTVRDLMDRLDQMLPAEATQLLQDSLTQLEQQPSAGIVVTLLGFVLALWASTGAMSTYMAALNTAYDRKDARGFVRKRLVAITMVAAIGAAVALIVVLLILGPHIEGWVGGALGIEGVLSWLWWVVQWPVLGVGLLAAFAVLHYFGPDVQHRHWAFITPGSVIAVVIWIAVSALFAVYTSLFDSYNKTWGSLSAVIVMLTWLWLTGLALLFGGEVNAEVERSRELRQGKPAQDAVVAPPRSEPE